MMLLAYSTTLSNKQAALLDESRTMCGKADEAWQGMGWNGLAEALPYCTIFVWKCPIGQRVCEVRYWPTAVGAACAVKPPALHGACSLVSCMDV